MISQHDNSDIETKWQVTLVPISQASANSRARLLRSHTPEPLQKDIFIFLPTYWFVSIYTANRIQHQGLHFQYPC